MTTTNFHSPQTNATNLRENIIAYGADQSISAIPEPGSALALGLLIGSGAFLRNRRRSSPAA